MGADDLCSASLLSMKLLQLGGPGIVPQTVLIRTQLPLPVSHGTALMNRDRASTEQQLPLSDWKLDLGGQLRVLEVGMVPAGRR